MQLMQPLAPLTNCWGRVRARVIPKRGSKHVQLRPFHATPPSSAPLPPIDYIGFLVNCQATIAWPMKSFDKEWGKVIQDLLIRKESRRVGLHPYRSFHIVKPSEYDTRGKKQCFLPQTISDLQLPPILLPS
jgi:hypothetical protein